MTENRDIKSSNMIHKVANNVMMVVFDDITNKLWDPRSKNDDGDKIRNNVRVNFVHYNDANQAKKMVPIFINADEMMMVMNKIRQGTFSSHLGEYTNYGGSHSGIARERKASGELEPVVDGIESRVFRMFVNNDGKLSMKASVYRGKKMNGGAIKQTGDAIIEPYITLDTVRAMTMAEAVWSYLVSRKTVCVSNQFNNE